MRGFDDTNECLVFDSINRAQLPLEDPAHISPSMLTALVQVAIHGMEMRASRIASEIAEAGIDPRL